MNRERGFWRPQEKDCNHLLFLNAEAPYDKHFSLISAGKSSCLSSYPCCLERVGQAGQNYSPSVQSAATHVHDARSDSKLFMN